MDDSVLQSSDASSRQDTANVHEDAHAFSPAGNGEKPTSKPAPPDLVHKRTESQASLSSLTEVDGMSGMASSRKTSSSSSRMLTHNTFSGFLGTGSAVGSFLLTTLNIEVDGDGSPQRDSSLPAAEDPYKLWGELLANWEDTLKRKRKTIRELVYQGVPDKVRCLVWPKLANIDESVKKLYSDLVMRDSPFVKVIRRDLYRTFPDHNLFKDADGPGQQALFNIMKAYSIYDREVGYCQGSPFIAGLLLMHMPEEDAFCVFVRLMHAYGMRDLFKPSMAALDVCLHLLDKLTQEHVGDLHAHFKEKGLVPTMFASSWFLTLFASSLTLEASFRIMDVFLCDSMEAVFRVAVSILLDHREQLLKCDLPGVMSILQCDVKEKYSSPESIGVLMKKAFAFKLSHRKLVKQSKEYETHREKDTEEAIENRTLRNENNQLIKKLKAMESEVQSMASELVTSQMSYGELVESAAKMRKELSVMKRKIKLEERRKEAERQDISKPLASSVPFLESYSFLQARVAQLSRNHQELGITRERLNDMDFMLASVKVRVAELDTAMDEANGLKSKEVQLSKEASKLRGTVAELRAKVLEADKKLKANSNFKETAFLVPNSMSGESVDFGSVQSVPVIPFSSICADSTNLEQPRSRSAPVLENGEHSTATTC